MPTLSPFTRGYLSLCRFFTAAVWCVPALRVPLVHSTRVQKKGLRVGLGSGSQSLRLIMCALYPP